MGFIRRLETLCRKNLLLVAWRQRFPTLLRAVLLPIAFVLFLSYVRLFFLPPSQYGVGDPTPIRNLLTEVFPSPPGHRKRIVFCNNGTTDGQIGVLIESMAVPLRKAGADVRIIKDELDLSSVCRSSLRGTSACYAAASFYSSPLQGGGNQWTYQITADFALGFTGYVNRDDNDVQMFSLPLMQYINSHIAQMTGVSFPKVQEAFPFTITSQQERDDEIQASFMNAMYNYLSVAFFVGLCGITFHLPGFLASERELGMSQLIDAMVPTHQLSSQISRLAAVHLAFDLIYLPGWIAIGVIVSTRVFIRTSDTTVILFHVVAGLALCGFSVFGAVFFRKSQLSGITVMIVSLAVGVVAQLVSLSSQSAVCVLSFLFPSGAYVFFLIELASWESSLMGADIQIASIYNSRYVPGQIYFIALAAQAICYPLLAIVVEKWLHGTSSKGRKVWRTSSDCGRPAIQITNMSKHYNSTIFMKGKSVKAVSNLNLAVQKGETMILLGANGSGKSTTLDSIAGMITFTSGLIELDGSRGIGFCPQKNVMWDQLTVEEHVSIFDRLKAVPRPSQKQQLDDLIRGCDLSGKSKKRAGALSGGQKRKLQLAMAFAGGSQVCCIDEVSSGLDPLSRRRIWDILIQEHGKRTFLLTTHALDEPDALADHVTIMSQGHVKVQGSVVELKTRYGGGYRILSRGTVDPKLASGLNASYSTTGIESVFQLASSAEASSLLERFKTSGVQEFQMGGPTMEDVFLNVAEEGREELVSDRDDPSGSSIQKALSNSETGRQAEQLTKGRGRSSIGQTWILFKKRVRVLTRNYIPYVCAIAIPLLTAALARHFLDGFTGIGCRFIDVIKTQSYITSQSGDLALRSYFFGPRGRYVPSRWPAGYQELLDSQIIRFAGSYDNFRQNFVDSESDGPYESLNATLASGGGFLGETPTDRPTLAYRMDQGIYGALFAKQILDSYLLGTTLDVRFSTFALPDGGGVGDSLQLIIYIGLAISTYPAFFALYPTFERLRYIRALHYSNGIQAGALWLAYLLFDLMFVIIVSVATIAIFIGVSNVWYEPGYLFVVFFLYGIASALLSYIISLFTTSQLAAFAFAAGGQAVFLLLYFIAYMALLSFSLPDNLVSNLNTVQYTLGLVTPSGNLLRAMLLTLNQAQLLCRDQSYVLYAGSIEIYGGPILYLTLQILVFYTFLLSYDNGWKSRWMLHWHKKSIRLDSEKTADTLSAEVLSEVRRTENSDDALRVLHLNKCFGRELVVNDLTFGVQHGEVFALLGPNGAGKSTTIGLIRGDLRSTTQSSDVIVENVSVNKNRTLVRRNLGVCPQFDAIDHMTVAEHLRFYAQAAGVPEVESNVAHVISATGLTLFADRLAHQLSGGNKRKLSLGVSIISNPSVLLLDEPSSGMDAISRRIMWKLLNSPSVKSGRSLVLTTHSMEEASALCDRAGIMAKRMLAVGTTAYLRHAHGNGFYVHIVHACAPDVSADDRSRLQNWMQHSVPHAVPLGGDATMMRGQLRYHVPQVPRSSSVSMNEINMPGMLHLLEQNKASLGIAFYAVSPTTLEDVFLNIVGSNGVHEGEDETEPTPVS